MKYLASENIVCSDLNDLREYDASWNSSYSFPDNIIVYYKDSVKLVDPDGSLLMEFIISPRNILEDSNIISVKFNNNILIVFSKSNLVLVDFSTNSSVKINANGIHNFRGNISNRNSQLGHDVIISDFLFSSDLYDYIPLKNNKFLISETFGKLVLCDLDNNYFYKEIGSSEINSMLLTHDKWNNRIWGFNNSSSSVGYISDNINGNFIFGNFVSLNIPQFNANDIYNDQQYLYIGHSNGLIRFHKNSGNILFFTDFDGFSRSVSYNSIVGKLNNIMIGTNGDNGALVTINKENMSRVSIYGKNSVFSGNKFYGVG